MASSSSLRISWDEFLSEAALDLAQMAREWSHASIPSEELRHSVQVRKAAGGAELFLPHYWAVYVHYGRGPAYPDRLYLIWFRDPSDDPRYAGGYPVGKPPRRLTKAEMRFWSAENRRADADGRPRPMVVAEVSRETERYKNSAVQHPALFWTHQWGLKGFPEAAAERLGEKLHEFVKRNVFTFSKG